ncbi:MAG: MotA/TolQ/ExbB proton channel family protein [Planctomycetota bacterium]
MQPPSQDTAASTLSWRKRDIEQRLAFRGGRFTAVNTTLTGLLGLLLTAAFYGVVAATEGTAFSTMFSGGGDPAKFAVPLAIVFFTSWAIAILLVKWRKLALQKRALRVRILPPASDFVLSPATVDEVLAGLYRAVDDPRHFVVLNRVQVALSNLKNLGRVPDVDDILRSQAEHDESAMETSYSLLRGFVWAIPVLGFIGTVLGLSAAIGGFGEVLSQDGAEMSEIAGSLRTVTSGLSTAFETTLQGLLAALAVQLVIAFLRKSEEEFLDDAREYCHRNIVSRLRMTPFDQVGA